MRFRSARVTVKASAQRRTILMSYFCEPRATGLLSKLCMRLCNVDTPLLAGTVVNCGHSLAVECLNIYSYIPAPPVWSVNNPNPCCYDYRSLSNSVKRICAGTNMNCPVASSPYISLLGRISKLAVVFNLPRVPQVLVLVQAKMSSTNIGTNIQIFMPAGTLSTTYIVFPAIFRTFIAPSM